MLVIWGYLETFSEGGSDDEMAAPSDHHDYQDVLPESVPCRTG